MQQSDQLKIWNFDEPLSYLDVLRAMPENDIWISRAGVAERLKRSKSPGLVIKLTDLVADDFLEINGIRLPNGVDMFVYRLTQRGKDEAANETLPPNWTPRK